MCNQPTMIDRAHIPPVMMNALAIGVKPEVIISVVSSTSGSTDAVTFAMVNWSAQL